MGKPQGALLVKVVSTGIFNMDGGTASAGAGASMATTRTSSGMRNNRFAMLMAGSPLIFRMLSADSAFVGPRYWWDTRGLADRDSLVRRIYSHDLPEAKRRSLRL